MHVSRTRIRAAHKFVPRGRHRRSRRDRHGIAALDQLRARVPELLVTREGGIVKADKNISSASEKTHSAIVVAAGRGDGNRGCGQHGASRENRDSRPRQTLTKQDVNGLKGRVARW